MRKVTKKDIDWVVNATFGKHTDPDKFIKTLPLRDIAKALIMVWEAGEVDVAPAKDAPHPDCYYHGGE